MVANSVDPTVFHKMPRNEALAAKLGIPAGVPVIGYVGSVVGYEGLDDLIDAAAMLRDKGRDFRILLVGDGEALPSVQERVRKHHLEDRVIAPGRVPSTEVTSYYSLIDIAPFPRKPILLCEIVSPLKPFEALAMHKAVIASDVAALAEIVEDGKTGLLFRKGDTEDLARALDELIVSLFVSSARVRPVAVQMWSNIRGDMDPTIAAIASLCFAFALLALFAEMILRRRTGVEQT